MLFKRSVKLANDTSKRLSVQKLEHTEQAEPNTHSALSFDDYQIPISSCDEFFGKTKNGCNCQGATNHDSFRIYK